MKKYLYRYYQNIDHVLDVIQNKRLYHCLPSEFNDPFDCRPLFSFQQSKNVDNVVWQKILYSLSRICSPRGDKNRLWQEAGAAVSGGHHRSKLWLEEMDSTLQDTRNKCRICCFAQSPRNMMMWAHYAKNHTGLVFQFRKSFLHDSQTNEYRGQEVNYPPSGLSVEKFGNAFYEAVETDGIDGACSTRFAALTYATKTPEWEREEEVRFFSSADRRYLSFREDAIAKVIFGGKCSERLIQGVQGAVKEWNNPPALFKASLEKSVHRLWIAKFTR